MNRVIALDTRVVGLLPHPEDTVEVEACYRWVAELLAEGDSVILPEVADYEIRREALRRKAARNIQRLDELPGTLTCVPLTTAAMRLAAGFWAQVRQQGRPTAPDAALDG